MGKGLSNGVKNKTNGGPCRISIESCWWYWLDCALHGFGIIGSCEKEMLSLTIIIIIISRPLQLLLLVDYN